MPTQRQIAANRRNAQLSTGPRSVEGKGVSSQNALQSGIDAESEVIPGEDPAALAVLAAGYLAHHDPQAPEERALVDMLIRCDWIDRRLAHAEASLWKYQVAKVSDPPSIFATDKRAPEDQRLGQALLACSATLARLERRRTAIHRDQHRALKDLQDLQASRPQPQPPLGPPPTPCMQKPNPEIGFVPEKSLQYLPRNPPRPLRRPPRNRPAPPAPRCRMRPLWPPGCSAAKGRPGPATTCRRAYNDCLSVRGWIWLSTCDR